MRLSGFSPPPLTTPRDAGLAGKGLPSAQLPDVKEASANVLSLITPLTPESPPGTPGSGQSIPPLDQLFAGLITRLLSGLNDAPTSPQALPQSASPDAASDQMSFEEVVSTLGRNENLLKKPLDREGIAKLRDDPATPSDTKKALDALVNNPEMFDAIDPAKNGKTDGKISAKDIRAWQEHPAIRQYADAKAETYTHDYVPSDAKPGSPAREMSGNDAMRELYLYSESLPKKVNLQTLQNIADGSQDMGKCPPQVAAAAKYFTNNPGEWQKFNGKDDPNASVSRDRLCDLAAQNVKLSPQENKALETLQNNKDIFFKGGGIKPDKLADIANDPKNSQEVRDAANLLSQPNSMLFSMLDNGKHGAGGNFFNKANDRNIGKGDLDAFIRKGSGEVAPAPQLANAPTTPLEMSAQEDMAAGQETQPDQKKEKGGGIFKLLDILGYVATGLTILIPGVGAAGVAATAGRAAVTAGVREGLKQAAKEGIQEGAAQAVNAALTNKTGNQEINGPRVWAQG
ncbi:HrpF/NolX family T3SS translocon protein [Siccibacter turicensis]|uniref:HrpF/NolX family T3SS translocon protein n=1 Tax=Siccibacter turicensis TaxID=357233 RepID=UPI0023EFBA82|nr:HrpF/NolX family T3SS translocon protein [Siccibacter turicensis]